MSGVLRRSKTQTNTRREKECRKGKGEGGGLRQSNFSTIKSSRGLSRSDIALVSP